MLIRGRRAYAAGAAAALISVAALAGCGNRVTTDIRGMTGLTADDQGRPVLLVAPCGGQVDRIGVFGLVDRSTGDPDRTNPVLVELRSATPVTQVFTVSLDNPGAPWEASGSFQPQDHDGFVVSADNSAKDETTTSLVVTRTAYEGVEGGRVLVREGESWSRADFDARACDRESWPSVTNS